MPRLDVRSSLVVLALGAPAFSLAAYYGVGLWSADPGGGVHQGEIALGREVYRGYCAACHGEDLEGQPNWRERLPSGRLPAPPHDASGHTWHHSDDVLFRITKFGPGAIVAGYESDMPAFEEILSDRQIHAVLAFIKSNWPAREQRYQEELNRREREVRR